MILFHRLRCVCVPGEFLSGPPDKASPEKNELEDLEHHRRLKVVKLFAARSTHRDKAVEGGFKISERERLAQAEFLMLGQEGLDLVIDDVTGHEDQIAGERRMRVVLIRSKNCRAILPGIFQSQMARSKFPLRQFFKALSPSVAVVTGSRSCRGFPPPFRGWVLRRQSRAQTCRVAVVMCGGRLGEPGGVEGRLIGVHRHR